MKKKAILGLCIFLAIVLLFPVRLQKRDGGTVEYKAVLYSVSDVHSLTTAEEYENGKEFNEGFVVEILGMEVFNNVA